MNVVAEPLTVTKTRREGPALEGVRQGLTELVRKLLPGARLVHLEQLSPDSGGTAVGGTAKAAGYGVPLRLEVELADGQRRRWVLHTQTPNVFGHDRRADRAELCLLAFDTYPHIPGHVRAVDVGAISAKGNLVSLRESEEFYLLTEYGEGRPYAEDLRRVSREHRVTPLDERRVGLMVRYLVELHSQRKEPARYRRAIRDLLGHGEGIFGIVDGYSERVPGTSSEQLRNIERLCLDWRWRLRSYSHRAVRTHGDFHPFNVLFDGETLTALDASRGGIGDAADDVVAMAVNFPFFAIDEPGAWERGLRGLWVRFWGDYLKRSGDEQLLEVIAPFLAWRLLVVCNPAFYPFLSPSSRGRLLGWAERALGEDQFNPQSVEEVFS